MKSSYCSKVTITMLAIIIMAGTLLLAACGSGEEEDSSKVAKVNDTAITQDQLDSFVMINMQLMGYDPSAVTEEEKSDLLDQLVNIQVIKEHYKEKDEELYGDDYDSAVKTFIESAHESAEDFLTQYEISDEQLDEFYSGQYAVSAMFREIQEENASQDMYTLASEYYNSHKDEFKNDDGTYAELDDVIQSVYYALYSEMYDDKISELKENMKIKVY